MLLIDDLTALRFVAMAGIDDRPSDII